MFSLNPEVSMKKYDQLAELQIVLFSKTSVTDGTPKNVTDGTKIVHLNIQPLKAIFMLFSYNPN